MGFFSRLREGAKARAENRAAQAGPPAIIFNAARSIYSFNESNSTAVQCKQIISESIACLPFVLYKKSANGREKARGFSEYDLLRYPNPFQTRAVFFSELVGMLLDHGNSYTMIQWDGLDPVALYNLDPTKMEVKAVGAKRAYIYDGKEVDPGNIIHIPHWLGYNGVKGQGVLKYARETVARSNSLQEYLDAYIENSAFTKVKMKVPWKIGALTKEDAIEVKLAQDFVAKTNAQARAGMPMVEYDDVQISKLELNSNKDSELSALMEIENQLICRFFGIPYSLLQGENKYDSIEKQNIQLINYCLQPYVKRIEQAFDAKLIRRSQRDVLYVEANYDGLLKADTATRFKVLGDAVKSTLMTPNEAREKENMDRNPATMADLLFTPAGIPMTDDILDAFMASSKLKAAKLLDDGSPGVDNKLK